jgi:2-polyprenyl-6-methoxyphenol hydroxylase-like FAD-dependent oxidoreductase
VVDATGRRSAVDRWLVDASLPSAETADDETGIVYYSRWYRLRSGFDLEGTSIPMDILSLRAILTPADDRFVSLAFSVAVDDDALKALRRIPAFQAVAQELPRIGEWVHPDRATPVTDVLFMGNLRNRHRRLRDAENEPIAGIVAIGDAATVTNPVFGRGVALGLAHAASLARALEEATAPVEAAEQLDSYSEESMRRWWEESRNEDHLRRLWMRAARGDELAENDEELLTTDEAKAHRALPIAMTRDPTVFRLLVRNLTSLDPPERLHGPEVTRRALALVSADELTASPINRDDLLSLVGTS